jgi:cytochrome c oxidase assembly protein subunit 15
VTASAAIAANPQATRPAPTALRRFAWFVVAYNVAVIVWGSAVRATSSGAGCGDHWPLCNGTLIQHHPRVATIIEFTHRAMSGVDLLCVLALLFWTVAAVPRRHLARSFAVAMLVLTLNEALLGALLVLLGLTANNQSPERAVYLGLHLTNTLLLLAALALTAHFLSRRTAVMRGTVTLRRSGVALTGLIAVLIVGVTGSLAALGDTLYPAHNLLNAIAQDFSSGSSWLLRIRWFHPAVSLIAGIFIVALILRALRDAANRGLAIGVLFLLGLQYMLGVLDLALLAPTWMQMTHLLGADLLWIALVILTARICLVTRPALPPPIVIRAA